MEPSKAPPLQITYRCENEDMFSQVIVGTDKRKSKSFKCEFCGLRLMPLYPQMELLAHGHTEKTIKHSLRQIVELAE